MCAVVVGPRRHGECRGRTGCPRRSGGDPDRDLRRLGLGQRRPEGGGPPAPAGRGDLRYVFPLGDNVYFTGQAKRFEGAFLKPYRRFLERRTETGERQIAFHAALGNHDVLRTCSFAPRDDGTLAPDREAYDWREPGCDVEEQLAEPAFGYLDQRRYYKVDVRGPAGDLIAEVLVLDSNTLPSEKHPDRQDTAQLDWLTETIRASRERARRHAVEPWRIITLHHPIRTPSARGYLFGFGGHQEDPSLLRAIENTLGREEDAPDQVLGGQLQPLLTGGAVDAVFAGHNHFYARLVPGADRIRHFVSGGGGIGVYEPDTRLDAHRRRGRLPPLRHRGADPRPLRVLHDRLAGSGPRPRVLAAGLAAGPGSAARGGTLPSGLPPLIAIATVLDVPTSPRSSSRPVGGGCARRRDSTRRGSPSWSRRGGCCRGCRPCGGR